ncbi:MAG TPA: thioredoxin [Nitrososphaerales archaeon]|nr:thioredoxin [Nitrososphaerales archaeon]
MSGTVSQVESGKFQSEVVQSALPVVVDFYADWCGPCRMVSPIIESLSKEFAGKAKFVKIDTDANQDLAVKFGIMSIPTVMFFVGGKVQDVVIGAAPAAVFKTKVDALLKK